jgi:hypothetical protein
MVQRDARIDGIPGSWQHSSMPRHLLFARLLAPATAESE